MTNKIKKSQNPYVAFEENFTEFFKSTFEEIYLNNNSNKFSEYLSFSNKIYCNDTIFLKIFEFKKILTSTNSLKKFQIGYIRNLNDVFAVYIFSLWSKNSEINFKNILQIVLLFRDFLNTYGWDIVEENLRQNDEIDFFENIIISKKKEFTSELHNNYFPSLIDDFLGIYINKNLLNDSQFKIVLKTTFHELSKILLEESLSDYVVKPLHF